MPSKHVELSANALFQEISGEGVILDLASSTYFGLNQVGARCWQLLQDNPELAVATKQLLQEFEVDAAVLEQDVLQLIEQLSGAGLVKLS